MARSSKTELPDTQLPTEPTTGPDDSLSAKDIIDRYTRGVKALRAPRFNYWLNDAYLLGDQFLYWNREKDCIDPIPVDDDRTLITVNHMWPASRTIIAKATQQPLQFYVPPSGADDSTLTGAKTAEAILTNLHREHDWEGIREDSHWAAWKGGTSAIRINWDPAAGQPLGMLEDGRAYGTGDTCEDVLNITDFVVEPGARDAEHARWWMVCIGLPPRQVQEMFNLPKEPPADGAAGATAFAKSVTNFEGDARAADIPLTRVYTLYQRPDGNTAGKVVTVVDNKIVDSGGWPFPFKDRLNFVVIRETRKEGTWVGETVLKAARPIQNAINQSWSSIVEHIKLAGNARLMLPESMMDKIDMLTDMPGEILPFQDGSAQPGYLSPPQMPNWWIEEPQRLSDEMDDILGVHEVSRGEAPGRVDSALGISILVEQDTTPVGRFVRETAGAFGRLATMALMIYADKVKETRKAVVKAPGQPPRTYGWTGKDLRGQVQAEVPQDAIVPRSRAADEARANQMQQMGLIKTVSDWYKVAGIPQDRDLLEALDPDTGKARRENAAMALGEIEVPEDFDNHNIHIQEHHTMMKSAEWDLMDDKTREIFRKHNKAHEVLAAEAAGRAVSKTNLSPVLGASASATGDPLVPLQALGSGGGAPPAPPDLGAAIANSLPLPGTPNAGGQVQLANPGVNPAIIQSEIGPVAGV